MYVAPVADVLYALVNVAVTSTTTTATAASSSDKLPDDEWN